MARTDNYSQLTCDRCGVTRYAAENSPVMQQYKNILRIDQGGAEIKRLYCATCATSYRNLVSSQDQAFSEFEAIETIGA